jgi:hypothetical protein
MEAVFALFTSVVVYNDKRKKQGKSQSGTEGARSFSNQYP